MPWLTRRSTSRCTSQETSFFFESFRRWASGRLQPSEDSVTRSPWSRSILLKLIDVRVISASSIWGPESAGSSWHYTEATDHRQPRWSDESKFKQVKLHCYKTLPPEKKLAGSDTDWQWHWLTVTGRSAWLSSSECHWLIHSVTFQLVFTGNSAIENVFIIIFIIDMVWYDNDMIWVSLSDWKTRLKSL